MFRYVVGMSILAVSCWYSLWDVTPTPAPMVRPSSAPSSVGSQNPKPATIEPIADSPAVRTLHDYKTVRDQVLTDPQAWVTKLVQDNPRLPAQLGEILRSPPDPIDGNYAGLSQPLSAAASERMLAIDMLEMIASDAAVAILTEAIGRGGDSTDITTLAEAHDALSALARLDAAHAIQTFRDHLARHTNRDQFVVALAGGLMDAGWERGRALAAAEGG